jgi:hypothetical protein
MTMAQPVDIELFATLEPSGPFFPPGSYATITLTVRNNGPSDSNFLGGLGPSVVTNGFRYDGPGENIIIFPTAETTPCDFSVESSLPVPGDATTYFPGIEFGALAAGEQRTCRVGLFVQDGAMGTHDLYLIASGAGPGQVETNPGNNTKYYELYLTNVASTPVPALGTLTTLLLALSVAAIAARSLCHEAIVARTRH